MRTMAVVAVWRGEFIERLKATGNVTLAATGAGVTRQHVYQTRNRNKKFRRLWDEALEQAVDLLDGEARRRATGMTRNVWYAGEIVGEERVYSDTLLIFLLKAHRPHLYRDNVKVEHSGGMEVTGDRKVTFEFVRPAGRPAGRGACPHAGQAGSRRSRARQTRREHQRGSRGGRGGAVSELVLGPVCEIAQVGMWCGSCHVYA